MLHMLPTANMSILFCLSCLLYCVGLLLIYVSIKSIALLHTHMFQNKPNIDRDINKCMLTIFPGHISSALLRTNICPVMEVLLLIINGSDKIVGLVHSLSWEANCARKSVASEIMNKLLSKLMSSSYHSISHVYPRVAVVLQGEVACPGPHVYPQEVLVRPLQPPVREGEVVLQDGVPVSPPQPPHGSPGRAQARPPHAAQQGEAVTGVVPHGVQHQPGPQPLPHRRHLPDTEGIHRSGHWTHMCAM